MIRCFMSFCTTCLHHDTVLGSISGGSSHRCTLWIVPACHCDQVTSNAPRGQPQCLATTNESVPVSCTREQLQWFVAVGHWAKVVDGILRVKNTKLLDQHTLRMVDSCNTIHVPHHVGVNVAAWLRVVPVGARERNDVLTRRQR